MTDGFGDIEGTADGDTEGVLLNDAYDGATDGSTVQGHRQHEVVHTSCAG